MAKSVHRQRVHKLPRPGTDEWRRKAKSRTYLHPKETLTLLVTACLLAFLVLPGCSRGEPPTAADLKALAPSCAENHPVITEKLRSLGVMGAPGPLSGWKKAKRVVKVLGAPEVGFPVVGYYRQGEGSTMIWPVMLHTEIILRKIEKPKAPGEKPMEKERVEKATVLCYAVKDKDGHWRLTALPPTDVTPFYQKGWYRVRGAGHS